MIYETFDAVPRGRYGVIYADPAWRFKTRSVAGITARSAETKYTVMSKAEICAQPVRDVAARDALLFLWTTSPHLVEALEVMAAWGFKYSTVAFVWAKTLRRYGAAPGLFYDVVSDFHMGTGYTTRANAEIVLLGRRGRPARSSLTIRQLCVSPVREHSRKPDEIRDRIAAYAGDVPKLEMNARQAWPGWDQWGNEVEKFAPVRPRRAARS